MANPWPRRIGFVFVSLVAIVVLAAGGIMGISFTRMGRRMSAPTDSLVIPRDSATLARGHHLATAIGKCVDCHGPSLEGGVMDMGPMGALAAANLTSGKGGIGGWSDADLVRAMRHGIRPDSSLLIFMPSMVLAEMNGPDLAALVAYLRSVPPVDHTLPATRLGPIGRLLTVTQPGTMIPALGIDHAKPIPAAVPAGRTPEYGRYLMVVGGCTYCHRGDLSGGLVEGPPGSPPSADLRSTGPTASWSEADFANTLRTGVRPDGSALSPAMPWRLAGQMTDEEIGAVWAFMRTR